VWMAGDRRAGGVHFTNIAGPKVFRTKTPDGYQLGLGFAGSPRVVQTVLAVAPPRLDHHGRLHPWLTSYCDSIHEVCAERGALASSDSDGARLAGETDFLLAIEGRVFRVGEDLAWEEPARGWECVGSGSYSWQGAFVGWWLIQGGEDERHEFKPSEARQLAAALIAAASEAEDRVALWREDPDA
jgi:hypothetical protein